MVRPEIWNLYPFRAIHAYQQLTYCPRHVMYSIYLLYTIITTTSRYQLTAIHFSNITCPYGEGQTGPTLNLVPLYNALNQLNNFHTVPRTHMHCLSII